MMQVASPLRALPALKVLGLAAALLTLPAALSAQEGMGEEPREAPKVQVSPAVEKALLAAVNEYLKADQSPLAGKVQIQVDSMEGETYRIIVLPTDMDSADTADAFLRKQDDGYKVLGLGTGFDDEFYARAKIPESLRDPVVPDIFLPLKPEVADKVVAALKAAVGKELKVEEKAGWTDYYSQDTGKAKLVLLTGNEKEVGSSKELLATTQKAFKELGWKEDKAYRDDASSGVTSMYRGPDNAFAFFSAIWNPSEDSGLSEEDDPAEAKLKPEQKIYRVEWYLAEPAPGQKLSPPSLDAGGGGETGATGAADESLPSN
jgi:hypothetical protein